MIRLKFCLLSATISAEGRQVMLEGTDKVQINKTDNMQINNLSEFITRTIPAGSPAKPLDEVQVEPSTAQYIQQALASEADAQEVERAKQLLASGQLDSPEAIRTAARNMIDLGI